MQSRTSLYTMLALMLLFAQPGIAAPRLVSAADAALTGIVRDAQGVPQMGALVELLTSDASTIATAFTDNHGHYIIPAVLPGRYHLRATAAFFLPASRENVRLQAGAEAIVNLTMSTLYETENWLPAQKRHPDEPADDWKWTLRSAANRPLLRMVDDGTVQVSSSADNAHRAKTHARVSVTSGDGGFGQGGVHQILLLDRTIENGDGAVLRADMAGSRAPFLAAPSAEIVAGYERRSVFGASTRLVTSYQSHPELTDGTANGAEVMRAASTEEFKFGDSAVLDAGTLMMAEHLQSTRISSQPFLRLVVRPGSAVLLEYRYAAGRELQNSEDLDSLKPTIRILTDGKGHPLSTKGSHHEVSVSRKLGSRVLQVAAYTDHLANVGIGGSGIIQHQDEGTTASGTTAILADPTTGSFALSSSNYSGRGVSVSLVQQLTPSLSAHFGYDLGTALTSRMSDGTTISTANKGIVSRNTYAANVSLRGKILHTGTTLRAEYHWQPERTLTQVNTFNSPDQDAYLGLYIRQRVWCGRWLPDGIDAVIEATNLLEQGYQPILSSDGHVLFLAQAPRAVQGGFAFNF
jgi:hypothetical protein